MLNNRQYGILLTERRETKNHKCPGIYAYAIGKRNSPSPTPIPPKKSTEISLSYRNRA
jgi:hypothetical protein